MELKPQHIQLISIQPGPIESNFGSITRQNMVVPEPDGVYDAIVKRAQEYFDNDFQKTGNTGPDKVAKVVWKAITAQRPKDRYRVTPIAHLLVIMKNILPTKWLDYVFLKQMGLSPKSLQNGSPERNYPDHRPEKQ